MRKEMWPMKKEDRTVGQEVGGRVTLICLTEEKILWGSLSKENGRGSGGKKRCYRRGKANQCLSSSQGGRNPKEMRMEVFLNFKDGEAFQVAS